MSWKEGLLIVVELGSFFTNYHEKMEYSTKQNPRIPWFSNRTINKRYVVIAQRLRSGRVPLINFEFLMRKVSTSGVINL